ncbi:lysophospholipid acyltransferase family protein [Xinfangfangia pollutisoli]|uniref:lysophospholipid acyltransferase family protein n=1 Tax=Xinfangfangia pollutisoli TaxID=2865960 RepID=UPI001CD67152|nr:lysophospholipid acyltransferase family protein [Xinfangfangia pollutisoli]
MSDWLTAPPPHPRIGPAGWLRALARGIPMAILTYLGLVLLLLLRLVEAPLFGPVRPWTPHLTQAVCRMNLALLGLRLRVTGRPMTARGAVVANHSSWLDIFVLNAGQRIYFVAKAEVSGWAFIGWLARATGTVFIRRNAAEARDQQRLFETRLLAGHQLLFFPEGTSTDSARVLPFKPTLFQAFFAPDLYRELQIQPVTVIYRAPAGADPRFYGWWGEMDFAPHLLRMLAARRHGRVEVIYHPPVPVDAFATRKELAAHCERVVRASHGG